MKVSLKNAKAGFSFITPPSPDGKKMRRFWLVLPKMPNGAMNCRCIKAPSPSVCATPSSRPGACLSLRLCSRPVGCQSCAEHAVRLRACTRVYWTRDVLDTRW